jgi:hypothetical protein
MYGGSVAETYLALWDPVPGLRRIAVWTENGAAAEYYARYGNFVQESDGWVVDTPPLTLASLHLRVDGTGRPELASGGERVALLSLVPDGSLVEIRPAASAGAGR